MPNVNYAQVRDALYHRESFTHGSCYGIRDAGERFIKDSARTYRVWSYQTEVLSYDLDAHRVTYFDNRYYSVTTSRLQNMIRDQFGMGGTRYDVRGIYDEAYLND